jgi:hypothetical protein
MFAISSESSDRVEEALAEEPAAISYSWIKIPTVFHVYPKQHKLIYDLINECLSPIIQGQRHDSYSSNPVYLIFPIIFSEKA